ncbi:uncharacterized protein F4812DRAFT_419040, partial [Daldinia caldariorum]|uniref:uncharacterized protein n=1 Tax=Daldinia caldariorum TaxID=326644 RepID=UPI002008199B
MSIGKGIGASVGGVQVSGFLQVCYTTGFFLFLLHYYHDHHYHYRSSLRGTTCISLATAFSFHLCIFFILYSGVRYTLILSGDSATSGISLAV